jgi:hypothetical protein
VNAGPGPALRPTDAATRPELAERLRDVADDERELILRGNVTRLYDFTG